MRILHVCQATRGAPWLAEIVRVQAARGHDVSVVIAGDEGPLPDALRRHAVRFIVQPHDPFGAADPLSAWRTIQRLARLMVDERPDVIQSHLFPSNIAARLAAWMADVPIRLSMNTGPYLLESPVLGDMDVRTASVDTRVIASCELTRELYASRGVARERTALVYYGSNPDVFDPAQASPDAARHSLGVSPDTPLVGLVAYFYPPAPDSPTTPPHLVGRAVKGHDVLLRAVPSVLARVPDAAFVLVGDGTEPRGRAYRGELEALARDLGVTHAVRFAGIRADVPDLLASFDVAVHCSLSENLGGTVEALLMATPMIVSRIGGLVDTVRHGETGLVVPADDPDALADAIVTLLTDRELARRLGAQGRALMLERFTVDRTADDLDALYADCARELGASLPYGAGYRWSRRVMRQVTTPLWALRLASPILYGKTGHRTDSLPAVVLFVLAGVLGRIRDVIVALVVLAMASPYFVWRWLRRGRQPLFSSVFVMGRHGKPFPLRTFTGEHAPTTANRFPWFLTLLATRQLTLFGPAPLPYDPATPLARTDPRVRRKPGIFTPANERRSAAQAHPRQSSRVERPS